MKLFCSNYWQNPQLTAAVQYFQKQPPEVFCKKGDFKNFANFIEKHLYWRQFFCERLLLYVQYNYHHQFHCHHFHYHRKIHLYCLSILLTIPLNCNMIPCLFQLNFVLFLPAHIFSSLIPSFSFFTPSKMTQDSFTTTRQILDVLSILISIVTYNLPTLIYTYLFILTFSLYYYINLIKLLNYEEYRNYDEIF